jgi:D-amino-acid oxidase
MPKKIKPILDENNENNLNQSSQLNRRKFVLSVAATTLACYLPSSLKAFANTTEVRKVIPPRLDTAYLGERVLCYRPLRQGVPNMTIETIGNQLVAHNYGHGGSGWTLAPGCSKYVMDLVAASPKGKTIAKNADITVIGGGVLGLFTAYELVQRGYTNITVVAQSFEKLTSHNAGGLLAPVSMSNNPEIQPMIDQVGIDAYKFYAQVAENKQAEFKGGAKIVPAYFEDRESSGLEPYVGKVMQPAKDVILDFGNGTQRKMVSYDDGIFIDTAKMMVALHNYLEPKVKFVTKKMETIADVPSELVFNCSGLGAGKLNNDADMAPVQGHLIMLKEQVPAHLQSMILVYFDKAKTTSGHEVKRSFYIFPKQLPGSATNDMGVVGGTFIEGATPDTPNVEEFDIMIANAKKFYGLK